MSNRTIIIGGGASGMMASISSVMSGCQDVLVIEKEAYTGKKLGITGKGRCNLTNDCDVSTLIKNVPINGRFLYSAFSQFSSTDTMQFFENLGVPLKTERGNRVFPMSDKAQDIVFALRDTLKNYGIKVIFDKVIDVVATDNKIAGITLEKRGLMSCDKVIICTGGLSYPVTGSTGDGYKFARKLGHSIITPAPSLVPLVTEERWVSDLSGLSLKNVELKVVNIHDNSMIYTDFGEMLFTHFGVSGPLILSASSHMRNMKPGKYKILIDLKPALDHKKLDDRLMRDFEEFKNRDFANAVHKLFPKALIPIMIELSGIDIDKKVNSITREERLQFGQLIKALPLDIKDFRPIAEAIITSGGINVDEINPKTMESKTVKGLYFAGEVIDCDAYTGGFNLQIAFSTGYVAGQDRY